MWRNFIFFDISVCGLPRVLAVAIGVKLPHTAWTAPYIHDTVLLLHYIMAAIPGHIIIPGYHTIRTAYRVPVIVH